MSFDEEARQSADALAAHLGREIQDRLQEFVSHLATAAADERHALADQAQQAMSASERTLEAAVLRAREETARETTARLEAEQADRQAAAAREAVARQDAAREAMRQTLLAEGLREGLTQGIADGRAQGLAEGRAQGVAEGAAASAREMVAAMTRLVAAFRRLDEGQSLSQLLDILAEEAAHEAPRCAVFVVRGASLHGWSFSGFDAAPRDARGVTLPLDAIADLAQVVERGQPGEVPHAAFSGDDDGPLSFVSLDDDDAVGVAVPVSVGGQVAALVYADDGADADADRLAPATWPDAIELLGRHAARCLEAQTAIRAARLSNGGHAIPTARGPVGIIAPAAVAPAADITYAEEHARRYARLLIADVRLHNEASVRAGREARDLWRRLRPEIATVRQSFDDRVSSDLLSRDRIFEEELVRTLADGDETLLGFETPGAADSDSDGPEAERLAV